MPEHYFKTLYEKKLKEKGTRCWKGYKKKGMKTMFGKRVPNCVKNEDVTKGNFGGKGGASQIAETQREKSAVQQYKQNNARSSA